MKKIMQLVMGAVLLVGLTGCSKSDNPSTPDIAALEQSLVGLWWDEYEYADVTEEGVPFSRVLLAVQVDADHTGCIYLGAFNDTDYYPLAVYGGPQDAGFTWRLLADGSVLLGDPTTGESYALTRSGGSAYGEGMTDVANTSVTFADNSMTLTNSSYSGELTKADAGKTTDIEQKLQALIIAVNGGDTGIDVSGGGNGPARARRSF